MKLPQIAVATMTLARTDAEGELIVEALTELARRRRPIVVTDGGSPPAFQSRLQALPNVRLQHAVGLVPQVVASLTAAVASHAPMVLYTEPDKAAFFAEHLDRFLETALQADGGAVSLAARTPRAFATYPPRQQEVETTINRACHDILGLAGDCSYGPFLMPRALAAQLLDVPAHLGWGWRHFAFARARRGGHALALVEGDCECPVEQRAEGALERLHRERQLSDNLAGLALGWSSPLPRSMP